MSDLPTSPFASTIFCDDIRKEANGKFILIGMYTGGMTFSVPPPQVISLALLMTYVEPRDYSEEEIRFEVCLSTASEPLVRATVMPSGSRPDVVGDDEENRLAIMAPVQVPPFTVDRAATLRVRWYCGDKSIHGGSLKIEFGQAETIDQDQASSADRKTGDL